jgi:hypothetical protein
MQEVRSWFVQNMSRFREQRTSTPTRSGESYVTIGRLVPITAVLAEVEGVLQFQRQVGSWSKIVNDRPIT